MPTIRSQSASNAPLRRDSGACDLAAPIDGIAAICSNQAEREQFFSDSIELAAIGIAYVHVNGSILYVNAWLASLLGYRASELVGMTVKQISHPDDKSLTDGFRAQLHAGTIDSFQLEKRYVRKDGSTVWADLRTAVKRSASGLALHDFSVIHDISARKQAEAALRDSEARFRSLTALYSDSYWEEDAQQRIVRMTRRGGITDERYVGRTLEELGSVPEAGWEAYRSAYLAHKPFRDQVLTMVVQGRTLWLSMSGEPILDEAGCFAGYRGVTRDITRRRRADARIEYLATHDSLTGLHNRSMFSQLLGVQIETSRRYEQGFGVMFIDLDRFKVINDSLGHEAGDQLLCEVAARLKSSLRASDVLARLGGDEFVVLLQQCASEGDVSAAVNNLMAKLTQPMNVCGHDCQITASIGVARFPEHGIDELTLMKNADIAMYAAKRDGKNTFCSYSPDLESPSSIGLTIETQLRYAMENGELSLHYQPKIDLGSDRISGVEALLRWNNPKLGSVSPAQFIPVAEETGLIVPIGRWVLRTACLQNAEWQRAGLPAVCVAVNLSPRQFSDAKLLDDVAAALNDSGLAPQFLELEITESVVMHTPERAIALLVAIKNLGVRLAIDDFGTGYSSLAQLKRFPIDTLKVDRSFIRDLPFDRGDMAITEAIIAMGRALSLTVVAEGVETSEQKTFLGLHSCDEMQGFHFSKPLPPEQFATLLGAQQSSGAEA